MNRIGPNPIYALMEAPHRSLIVAGLSFIACLLGTMMALAYTWPHAVARAWLYLTLVLTVYFLIQALLDYRAQLPVPADPAPSDEPSADEYPDSDVDEAG